MKLPHKQLRAKDTFSASWAWCNASAWTSPESQISRMKRTSTLVQPLENDISFYLKYLKNWLYAPSIALKCIWRTASERKLWNINHLCNYLQASGGLLPQGECPSRGGQPRHENQDKECARDRNQSAQKKTAQLRPALFIELQLVLALCMCNSYLLCKVKVYHLMCSKCANLLSFYTTLKKHLLTLTLDKLLPLRALMWKDVGLSINFLSRSSSSQISKTQA